VVEEDDHWFASEFYKLHLITQLTTQF
jgi:hypothetical protein